MKQVDTAGDGGRVHLVGSVPLADSAAVFATVGAKLGDHLARMPDGETGERLGWVQCQYPLLKAAAGIGPSGRKHPYSGFDLLAVEDGADPQRLDFGPLGYAAAAATSYPEFLAARDAGRLRRSCRFQVNFPTPHAVVGGFFVADLVAAMEPVYERHLVAELDAVTAAIPAEDLAIQFDIAREFQLIEGIAPSPYPDVMEGILERFERCSGHVPGGAQLGFHLCYGDFDHRHFKEPADTANLVKVANGILEWIQRPVDWIHMPVPRDRDDDAYFEPLKDLKLRPETKLFLGLVHHTDGLDGTRARLRTAQRHAAGFGVATECGLGRRPPETIPELLDIHAEIAATL